MATKELTTEATKTLNAFFTQMQDIYTTATAAGGKAQNLKSTMQVQALAVGDVLTFKAPTKGNKTESFATLVHPAGNGIKYAAIDTVDRSDVSLKMLLNIGSGINMDGKTLEERITAFIAFLDSVEEISYRVKSCKVIPSINPNYSDQRKYVFEQA